MRLAEHRNREHTALRGTQRLHQVYSQVEMVGEQQGALEQPNPPERSPGQASAGLRKQAVLATRSEVSGRCGFLHSRTASAITMASARRDNTDR